MAEKSVKIFLIMFIILLAAYFLAENNVRERFAEIEPADQTYFVPDKAVAAAFSLGFQNLWADLAMIRAQLFAYQAKYRGREKDRRKLVEMVKLILALDRRYTVAAVFANFVLGKSWGLMGVVEANEILERTWRMNPETYKLAMHIGYNHYIYGGNSGQAIRWLSIAMDNPKAPRRLIWVLDAVRKRSGSGYSSNMLAMCGMCGEMDDPKEKKHLCLRCALYRRLVELEKARKAFEKSYGRKLDNLSELVYAGLFDKIPGCPLGGEFVITSNGTINSTKNIEKEVETGNR